MIKLKTMREYYLSLNLDSLPVCIRGGQEVLIEELKVEGNGHVWLQRLPCK